MAESKSLMDKNLVELEKEITCAICLNHFTQPKILPCCHYYCKQCILNLALRTGTDKPFSCPECRKEVNLLEGSVDQLPTAFIVNRFMAAFATLEQAHGKGKVKCEACMDSGAEAQAFCRQCTAFICQECVKSHERLKVYHGHEVISLEELKQGRTKKVVVKEPPVKKCLVHEEPLIVHCFDCDNLICHYCMMKDHKDHNFEFCKIAAANIRKQVMQKLEHLREMEVSFLCAVKEIQTTKYGIKTQGDSAAQTIHTSFEELHKILEKHKQELLEDVVRRVGEKTNKLSLQEENLSQAIAKVHSVCDYAKQSLSHCTDHEVMIVHAEITSRAEKEIEEYGQLGRSVEPVEEVDVGVEVSCAEALQQLCQTKAKIIQFSIDPAKCTVTVEGLQTAEVSIVSKFTLTTRLSNNHLTKRTCEVNCHLKSLCNGSIIKCNVDRIGSSDYSIQCTPTVRGRHELTVSVDGQQVAGSPFRVLVSLPPTQLGKPLRVWTGVSQPTGVTVNSVGEIIVIEHEGNIITFDKEGNRRRSVKSKLGSLSGVAVDEEDNIYCTDRDTDKIFTSNKNGGNIQLHKVKQVRGPGHRGVAVVGDEVMVCERHNKGTIMVYNRKLKYVRQIVGRDMKGFIDLSPDRHGNLYVTDYKCSCIRVFNNDGDFLRSFGCDGNGVKKLSGPRRICVAGQYVYVADCKDPSVLVFTTGGEYVTSFGHPGHEETDFSGRRRTCVDKDGFVYVTNFHRIQIF